MVQFVDGTICNRICWGRRPGGNATKNFGSTWCRHAGGNTCEHVSITAFDIVMQAVFAKAYIKACVTLTRIGYMVEFVSVTPGVDMLVGLHGLR